MKPLAAGAVWAAALALGGLTGTYLLPGTSPADSPTATPAATPSPSPSPTKRLTESDLLSVQSFADQSVSVSYESQHGKADRTVDATSCVSDDVHASSTLKDVTGQDPSLEGDWVQTGVGDGARQLVAVADDPTGAETSVARLLAAMKSCQEAKPGHVVLGPASTENFSSTRSATWVGFYAGEQNTTGRAPEGVEPCGGTLLARNGARFTAVAVFMCLDQTQLAGLAAAASERLG